MVDTEGVSALRVVLADDHRLTANALSDSLRAHGVDVVSVVHSVPEAMVAISEQSPDVLVSDLDMGPGPSGLDLADKVRHKKPRMGIVILTAYEEPRLFSGGMKDVPDDWIYLVKHQVTKVDELLGAVDLAYRYGIRELAAPKRKKRFVLSDSQASLLRLVARGLSNQAIAEEMSVTTDSVAKAINRLVKRLGVQGSDSTNVRVALTQRYFDYVGFQRES